MPSLRSTRAFALLALISANPAFAQQTKFPDAQPSEPASDSTKKDAARRFGHAIALYEDADYTLALAEFERVYELMPDYRVLYNIGQVSIQLGRYARALRTLKEYVARGDAELPPDRLQAVQADLELLAGRVATVTVLVDQPGAQIFLDGAALGTSPLSEPSIVDVGERTLQVKLAGFTAQTQRLTLAGGDRREIQCTLERDVPAALPTPVREVAVAPAPWRIAAPPPRTHGARTWIGWTATGALTAGALVSGALGASAVGDLKVLRATGGADRAALDRGQSRAETRLLVADLLAAAALVSGTVTLYFQLSSPAPEAHATARPPLKLRFTASRVSLIFEH